MLDGNLLCNSALPFRSDDPIASDKGVLRRSVFLLGPWIFTEVCVRGSQFSRLKQWRMKTFKTFVCVTRTTKNDNVGYDLNPSIHSAETFKNIDVRYVLMSN